LAGFAWAVLSLGGCSNSDCVLDDDLRLFAGDGALDCGIADAKHDRADIDKCAADAFDAGTPFMARYERTGVTAKIVTAVATNTDGVVKIFRWDTSSCGGASCAPVTDVQSCDGPTLNEETSADPDALPLSCDSLGVPRRICG
jgi:hypothetical protein